jgi:hypothetical protein
MTNEEINYLRMVVTRKGVMNLPNFTALWSGNAKIVATKNDVESLLAQILTDAGIQEEDIKGSTTAKKTAWIEAAKWAVHICTGMRAYAEDAVNPVLYQMMHYKKSDLDRGEIQEVLNRMAIIYNQAILIPIGSLTPFNVTAANLTSFNNSIQALNAAFPQHGVLQDIRKTSTKNIKKNLALLRKAGKKLNNLVQTLRLTQPVFLDTYDNSCIIIDLGKGQMAEERKLQPGEHMVLFTQKFLKDDTFTFRNHSAMAKIKVFLSDTSDVPATGGIEIAAQTQLILTIPTGFKMPFGHSLIILNEATMDDAHVTVVLAHGKSHAAAMKAGSELAKILKKTDSIS